MKILTSVFAAAALLVAPVPAMAQRHGGGRGYGGFHGGFHGYGGFRGYGFGGFYYPYWGGFCPVPPFGVDPYPWYYCYPGYYGPAYWGYDGPPPLPRRVESQCGACRQCLRPLVLAPRARPL